MKKINYLWAILAMLTLGFYACEEETTEETPNPYAGKWVSNVYPSMDVSATNDTTYFFEQMKFEFTNTTFVDDVYRSKSLQDTELTLQVSMGGNITDNAETLNASINSISLGGGAPTYKDTDPESFAAKYNATLGKMLNDEFIATYSLYSEGDSMQLQITTKGNSIIPLKLGKQ